MASEVLCGPSTSSLVLTVQVPKKTSGRKSVPVWRLRMVLLGSGLGTAGLSRRPEPRSPFRVQASSLLGSQRDHPGSPGILYEAACSACCPTRLGKSVGQRTVGLQDLKLHGEEMGARVWSLESFRNAPGGPSVLPVASPSSSPPKAPLPGPL